MENIKNGRERLKDIVEKKRQEEEKTKNSKEKRQKKCSV